MKMNRWESLQAFCSKSAWEWNQDRSIDDTDHFQYFTANFLVEYNVTVTAVVSDNSDSINLDGHIGVLWLEAEWENDWLSYENLECMQYGIILAEENLLRNGVPFTADYKFHGNRAYQHKLMNERIRKQIGTDEIETELYEEQERYRKK